jgi:hypothetical protein
MLRWGMAKKRLGTTDLKERRNIKSVGEHVAVENTGAKRDRVTGDWGQVRKVKHNF